MIHGYAKWVDADAKVLEDWLTSKGYMK